MKAVFVLIFFTTWQTVSEQFASKKNKDLQAIVFPALSYSPETKWLIGAGAASTFHLHREDKKEKPSSINIGLGYTQNKQILTSIQYSLFDRDKHFIFGELSFYKFSYYFYGLGQQKTPEELYKATYPRIRLNITKKTNKSLYYGLGIHFENYDITETESTGELVKGIISGSQGSRVLGLGLLTILDTRDSIFYPKKGVFGNFSFFNYGKHFGGNIDYSRVIADIAIYKKINKTSILALQSYNSFVLGNAPFQQQSQLGGSKLMRGYLMGRFIDKNLSLAQSEVRIKLLKRFAAAFFASAGVMGNERDFLRLNDIKYSYGAGLRFTFNRKEHLNARFDYAISKERKLFYFTIGEAF